LDGAYFRSDTLVRMIETIPFQLLLAPFIGWIGRHQARTIAYLIEENRVLKEQLVLPVSSKACALLGHSLSRG
jgi:hypothetical protein